MGTKDGGKKPNPNDLNSFKGFFYYMIIILVMTVLLNGLVFPSALKSQVKEVGYNEFLTMVDNGQVAQVEKDDTNGEIVFITKDSNGKQQIYKTGLWDDPDLTERLYSKGVTFDKVIPQKESAIMAFFTNWILPFMIMIGLGQILSRSMAKRMGGNAMTFGKSNAKIYAESETGVTFADVAGEEEAKDALKEIVDFLHDPKKYADIGATLPKGALLVGGMGGNDEREQTLNQLLTEMDGFDGRKGVVILAATNRPETLDKALLRPGRFDRRIPVELPDLKGREAILRVHGKDVKMDESVDFNAIARATVGASGAELANIINEGALRAVRMGRRVVSQADLEESVETVIAGYQKKNASVSENERRIVAYHEIGHALVAACQSNSAPVHKITIIPRTSGALGYTMQVEDGERLLMSKEEALNKIATLTGGRAAEKFMFHSITTGASNDIEQATKLARAMVTRYGMSDQFGMVALETVTNQYLGGDTSLACSPETAKAIDDEVIATVKAQYEKAMGILRDHAAKLNELAGYLLEKETITGEEFMEILNR